MLKRPFELIVSLPQNDPLVARAAEAGKATAIKVHCNCLHPASKTKFGCWREEKRAIQSILSSVSIPVGLMPGHGTVGSEADLRDALASGIQFLDLYREDAPPWLFSLPVQKMLALSHEAYTKENWQNKNFGDILEASWVPQEEYGTPLTPDTLEHYRKIVTSVSYPVFVPTQKQILPEQIAELKKIGVRGLILGAVVLGQEREKFQARVAEYAKQLT